MSPIHDPKLGCESPRATESDGADEIRAAAMPAIVSSRITGAFDVVGDYQLPDPNEVLHAP